MFLRSLVFAVLLCFCLAPRAEASVYVFALSEDYPPMHMTGTDGAMTGFNIELFAAICKAAGITPAFVHTQWNTIFDELAEGKFSAVVSAATITDARRQKVDFTDPYFEAMQTVVVLSGAEISRDKDLKDKKIGAWGATTSFEECRRIARFSGASQVVPFPDVESSMFALAQGQLDAVFTDSPTAASYVFEDERFAGKLAIGFTIPSKIPDNFGFPVNKNEQELLGKLNAGLKAVKASGEYDRIYEKWFSTMAQKSRDSKWNIFNFKFPW